MIRRRPGRRRPASGAAGDDLRYFRGPGKTCPHCRRPRLRRLISAPVFRLKGGGWYETDFKSDKESKRNLHAEDVKADKGEGADKAPKPDAGEKKAEPVPAKAEAKAEQKPEAKPAKRRAPRRARRAATGPRRR